jgi:hypothetical protein
MPIITVLLTPFWLATAIAESDEHHHHASHQHGHAALDIALQQQQLYLLLESPAANIVGFEHPPRNAAQQQQLQQATQQLKQAEQLFSINPEAGCKLQNAKIETPLSDQQEHSNVTASYQYHCQHPQHLSQLRLTIFERFLLLEELDSQVLTDQRQFAAELSPQQALLTF